MAGRGAGGGPGKSDVHLGAVRGGGPRRSKHPPLRAAGGVSFRPEAGSQHLAFHSRERVLRCIDQYTARQYRHQSGQKEALAFARTSSCTSKTVSRVMSWMVIYLGCLSPDSSSGLPGSRRAALCSLFGLASDGVYMCPLCYQRGGSLLHCLSTLTRQAVRFISVALSLESPPPDVIWHPAL